MSLAPICILYCKQCNTMNGYIICWFSLFGFLGEKYQCNVCTLYLFYSFTENMFAIINCTRLKSTFGIRALLASRGCLCGQGFGSRL
jgi:hypothetical protein